MSSLVLKFTDEYGVARQAEVDRDRFTIGRHSGCDLAIADARLSREHVVIERQGNDFVVSDRGSSNGTDLNGIPLDTPVVIRHGDKLDLGGGVLIDVEFRETNVSPKPSSPEPAPPKSEPAAIVANGQATAGIPMLYFVAAPIVALLVIVFVGSLIFVFSSRSPANTKAAQDIDEPLEDDRPIKKTGKEEPAESKDPSSESVTSTGPSTSNSSPSSGPVVSTNLSATAKVEEYSAKFLRRIAQNDSTAFLTSEQAKIVDAKIKQIAGNSALAGNLNSAKKNSSQLATLARSKNLTPEFLSVAAINKLGTTNGNVVQTAQAMAEILDKLGTQIGSELSDDSLLMIAAYDQGAAGEFLKMRNMLQGLSNEFPESSRAIRTIWFLNSKKKISSSDFDRALTFLAIGTISQAPKEFGVNAEPLIF